MVVPSPPPLDKPSLRQSIRAQRRSLTHSLGPALRETLEHRLSDLLLPSLASAHCVAGYHPMRDEISPLPALERAEALGKSVAFPAFAGRDHHMVFRAGPAIDPGPWAILQPADTAPEVQPDLVLIPLVAVDGTGHRIGQGKGHYDRALPKLRESGARLVGIGWNFQLVDGEIAHEPWDVPLDAFVSPDGLIEFDR